MILEGFVEFYLLFERDKNCKFYLLIKIKITPSTLRITSRVNENVLK